MMGLHVSIYRSKYDSDRSLCHGLDAVTVTNVSGPFDPTPDSPAYRLEPGPTGIPILRPDLEHESWDARRDAIPDGPRMAAGILASSSDSRWCEAVRRIGGSLAPNGVGVHDYVESWDQYREMTRMD